MPRTGVLSRPGTRLQEAGKRCQLDDQLAVTVGGEGK